MFVEQKYFFYYIQDPMKKVHLEQFIADKSFIISYFLSL